ncbi:ABC transporter substrate-binding protein [Oceanicella actignis]|uniref:Peptide/nickel transport system substrate-binding protein n=1 Tax=Oceanicella actignis TaxID=1189325 RepID=A0A1M7TNP4_9RHOB|nr:ABC transporter substrate-binding protein [Oceanicella actignis]SET72698.1 peptide/nickel transport system substrate-binding protein [Oceanicella actignis]SHN72296.1 peptide/nickel transport system substrate-binding protein [Oceanicella actignis]
MTRDRENPSAPRARGLSRRQTLAAGAALAAAAGALPRILRAAPAPVEPPFLAARVASGALPPVAARLPEEPLVVDLAAKGRAFGRHGGTLRTLFSRARDIRYMVVYGYARLVGWDHEYNLRPDILREVDVEDERVFTLHLRKGHKWSDGHPFTTEDFRYWWEDVANNPHLSPSGPLELMLVDGAPPQVTVLSETAIRYEWRAPNPRFLPALAQARPPFIYRPAHYLKRYHADYVAPEQLAPLLREYRTRNWAQLHNRLDDMYKFDNPALPTLQPWVNTMERNSDRYVLERNPYFHRVDAHGLQLPYVDRVDAGIAAAGLIPSKITLGEADLQARTLSFSDAPVLKKGERTGGYRTLIWRSGAASEIALHPNLNYEDPAFRALLRDVRFRRALSLAIDRRTINRSLYFGLAREAATSALPASPFYDEAHARAFAQYDPAAASALLDELGLDRRDGDGTRLLPDGRRLEIVVESAGERPVEADAMELVAETWREVGVRLIYRPLDRDILRNAAYQGRSMMPLWYGWNNGLPNPDTPPTDVAPVDQANFCWPMWGQHFQTRGRSGQAPDTPEGQRLLELFKEWNRAADRDARARVWREMLDIHARNVFSIGIVNMAPQPVIANTRLRNVPAEGIYAWDPGAQLGVHRIDEFFYEP